MNQNNLWITHKQMILILIVMEEGLVPFKVKYVRVGPYEVLILMVGDEGLIHNGLCMKCFAYMES